MLIDRVAAISHTSDLTGKVAFITGAAGGIGLGIAQALVEVGVKVALADIDEAALDKSVAELAESGAEVVSVPLDVTDRSGWAGAVERVRAALGTVRVLVNNAGISTNGMLFDDVDPQVWDRVMDINLTGVYNGVHYFLPGMRPRGSEQGVLSGDRRRGPNRVRSLVRLRDGAASLWLLRPPRRRIVSEANRVLLARRPGASVSRSFRR